MALPTSQMRKFLFSCFTLALLLLLFPRSARGLALSPSASYDTGSAQRRAFSLRSSIPDVLKLSKREEKDEYSAAIKNGDELLTKVKAADTAALKSPFTDIKDLATWGWSDHTKDIETKLITALANTLKSMKVDTAKNEEWEEMHQHEVTIKGIKYQPTYGEFNNIYNAAGGLVIADDQNSPAALKPDWKPAQLPKLRNWSDVVFLKWQSLAKTNTKKLKYVLRSDIRNTFAENILKSVFKLKKENDRDELEEKIPLEAKAKVFSMNTDEGKALLGTPNGKGVAWLLINHKAQLGMKQIKEVKVWKAWKEEESSEASSEASDDASDDESEDESDENLEKRKMGGHWAIMMLFTFVN